MVHHPLRNIEKLEADLWEAADNLRANSKLTSSDYFMPVLGVIFLRHAANRFDAATRQIQEDQASGKMPKRAIVKADYLRRRALWLPKEARYDTIMALPADSDLPKVVTDAMTAIEKEFEPLQGVLPKEYGIFERQVLEDLLRLFNSEQIKQATGDVFGRIYEYFLAKFSVQKAHDNGEFFTPPSLVQLIVNVIEPDHGTVGDLASGSAGMFVQSSHFIEHTGGDTAHKVVFYGQEKNRDTIRLAKMNLAVHGLEGRIAEAITYYQDEHSLAGKCDFVMCNPPFNVDLVDAERIKGDPRLPFGLPGVNKQKKVSNGNYLWISYFWSYLNDKGRAGFVMSSQASSAGHGEKEVRRRIVETGDVDVMISIRSNFFYTRSVPCELWFFDRGKPKERRDQVLMIDARNIYRKVTRKINDFSLEQLANLTAIVWLYRGQRDRFLGLRATRRAPALRNRSSPPAPRPRRLPHALRQIAAGHEPAATRRPQGVRSAGRASERSHQTGGPPLQADRACGRCRRRARKRRGGRGRLRPPRRGPVGEAARRRTQSRRRAAQARGLLPPASGLAARPFPQRRAAGRAGAGEGSRPQADRRCRLEPHAGPLRRRSAAG